MFQAQNPKQTVVELCQLFYQHGWVSGTGGGLCIRQNGRVHLAPSGVQKERMTEADLFELDEEGNVITAPADERLRQSACKPLFYNAFRLRNAGAVMHSHSLNAVLATLISPGEVFRCTHLEMMKGIRGVGYHDVLEVPIIDNTAHERDLEQAMAEAIEAFPHSDAVLVRRHGVYVWGRDWVQAKTQAECYDYLFGAAVRMHQLGLDPAAAPSNNRSNS